MTASSPKRASTKYVNVSESHEQMNHTIEHQKIKIEEYSNILVGLNSKLAVHEDIKQEIETHKDLIKSFENHREQLRNQIDDINE